MEPLSGSEPRFRVLGRGFFVPDFEVEDGFAADSVDGADFLAGGYFLPGFYGCGFDLRVCHGAAFFRFAGVDGVPHHPAPAG